MTRRAPKRRQAHNSKRTAVQQVLRQDFSLTKIELLCSEIAREFRPNRIVLFGSHSYGDSRPDSDIDLLVVMPFEGSPFRQAAAILGHLVRTVGIIPLDLLVRTAQQVQERIQMGDSFMQEIIERGRVMYEADHP